MNLLETSLIYLKLLETSLIYLNLLETSRIYLNLLETSQIYLNLLETSRIYLKLKGLEQLESIVAHAECMGLAAAQVSVQLELAAHNYGTYSGIVFRFTCQARLRKSVYLSFFFLIA